VSQLLIMLRHLQEGMSWQDLHPSVKTMLRVKKCIFKLVDVPKSTVYTYFRYTVIADIWRKAKAVFVEAPCLERYNTIYRQCKTRETGKCIFYSLDIASFCYPPSKIVVYVWVSEEYQEEGR
jgi:hypothetical protein